MRSQLRFAATIVALLVLEVALPAIASGADARADLLKLIDRPRVAAAAVATTMPSAPSLIQYHFTYASDAADRVPGIIIESATATTQRRPVVIALHGTGGNKDDMLSLMRRLARRGFVAVAIDGRYHGERSKAGTGTVDYEAAIVKAWHDQHEHPFYFDTIWDVMRLIDYLGTRDDVDVSRVGMYGVSKGGIETYLTAAVDPRVAVAIPCIGLESFKWALDHNDWQTRISTIQGAFDAVAKESKVAKPDSAFVAQFYQRVVPGIDSEFDGPEMVKLIAPRPLMAINGDSDSHTPLPGLKLCTDAATTAFTADGAADHFQEIIEPNTAHNVNRDAQAAAIEWFAKWLKPGT